jgi:hypothetical protein
MGNKTLKNKTMLKLVGIGAAAMLLSSCSGSVTVSGGEPEWKPSLSQSAEVPAETVALLEKAEPQFKTDKFSATFVPLGERVDTTKNQKVATFAVSANLPANCLGEDGESFADDGGSGTCLDFTFGAATERVEQEGKDYKLPLHSTVDTAFLKTTNGASIVEISSPVDAEKYIIHIVADGGSVMLNPVSGEVLSDSSKR